MLPVALCEWKIPNEHPILSIAFKNVLRIFKVEIFKSFKNIQPQKLNLLIKRGV